MALDLNGLSHQYISALKLYALKELDGRLVKVDFKNLFLNYFLILNGPSKFLSNRL
jgi:hypothetical protein